MDMFLPLTVLAKRHVVQKLQSDPEYIQNFTPTQFSAGAFDIQSIEVVDELVVVAFKNGNQIKRALSSFTFLSFDDPSQSTAKKAATFQTRRSKRCHSEEPENQAPVKHLKSRQETNAQYIDRPVGHDERLPDMPALLKQTELSTPLHPATTNHSATEPFSSSPSSRNQSKTISGDLNVVDNQSADEYQRVQLDSEAEAEEPEIVISARRIPRSPHVKNVLAEPQEDASSTGLESAEIHTLSPSTSNEHSERVIEKAKNPPGSWGFGERYRKTSRLPVNFLPKVPQPPAVLPNHPTQMNLGRRKPGGGGPSPQNTLGREFYNGNLNTPFKPPTIVTKPQPNKFDLHTEERHARHRPGQTGNKRQRMNDESSNHLGSSTSPIDLEQVQRGDGRSNPSQILSSTARHASLNEGVREYGQVERSVRPRGPGRERDRKSFPSDKHELGMGEKKRRGPNYFKHMEAPETQEDVDDPISDTDTPSNVPAQRKSTLQVVISSPVKVNLDQIEDTAVKDSKQAPQRRETRSSGTSLQETKTVSHYFDQPLPPQQKKNSSRHRLQQEQGPSQTKTAANGHEQSSPDRAYGNGPDSADELAGNPPSPQTQNKADRKVAQVVLKKWQIGQDKSNQQKPTVIEDSTSDQEEHANRNIKQSTFGTTKKTTLGKAKTVRVKPDNVLDVLQIFSNQHSWLDANTPQKWSIRQNCSTKTLMVLDHDKVPHGDLNFNPEKITMVIWNKTNTKIVLKKSKDQSVKGDPQVFLELGTPDQATTFALEMANNYGSGVDHRTDSNIIDKMFEKCKSDFTHRLRLKDKRLSSQEIGDDVQRIQRISESKLAKHQAEIQQSKIATGGRRLRDGMKTAELTSYQHTRRSVPSNDAEPVQSKSDDDAHEQYQGTEHSSAQFYGNGNMSSGPLPTSNTRASTRLYERERNPSPAAPTQSRRVKRWSESNPDWIKEYKWKKSVVYPLQGKNKTTVDEQDILRLDEDEFLNDNLIHFYISFLEQRLHDRSPATAKRILFMNSFFYLRLSSGASGKSGINYQAVERWTSKVNIFEYDYIIVPVNEAAHWYLAIICNAPKLLEPPSNPDAESNERPPELNEADKATASQGIEPEVDSKLRTLSIKETEDDTNTIENRDIEATKLPSDDPVALSSHIDLTEPSKPKPGKKGAKGKAPRKHDNSKTRIITLDSLGGAHSSTCTNLKRWLIAEAESKMKTDISQVGPLGMTAKHIPQQPNYCDCGLYLLMYLEMFLDDPESFTGGILAGQLPDRGQDGRIWEFNASVKRNEIRDLLLHLQRHSKPSIEELMEISRKYITFPVDQSETTLLEPSNESQLRENRVQQPSSTAVHKSNSQSVITEDSHEARNHTDASQTPQHAPTSSPTTAKKRKSENMEVALTGQQPKGLVSKLSGYVSTALGYNTTPKEKTSVPQARIANEQSAASLRDSRSREYPSKDFFDLEEKPIVAKQSAGNSRTHDAQPSSLHKVSPFDSDTYAKAAAIQSIGRDSSSYFEKRPVSSSSSRMHTVEHVEDSNLQPKLSNPKRPIEILDSQDCEEEDEDPMLLEHTESGGDSQARSQNTGPSYLSEDSAPAAVPSDMASVEDVMRGSTILADSRPGTGDTFLNGVTSPRSRKRKAGSVVHEDQLVESEQHSNMRPHKQQKQQIHDNSKVPEEPSVPQDTTSQYRDASDRSVVGHRASRTHIRFTDNDEPIQID